MKLPKKGLLIAAAASVMGLSACAEPQADLAAAGQEEVNRIRCWDDNGNLRFNDLTRKEIYLTDSGFKYTDEKGFDQRILNMACIRDEVIVNADADLDDPNIEILKQNSGNAAPSSPAQARTASL